MWKYSLLLKNFMFIRLGNCCIFFRSILLTVLLRSFSSALALLPACWWLQYKKRESVYTKDRGNSVSRHGRFFFLFFFFENKLIETFIIFGTFSLRELLNTRVISTRPLLRIIFVIKIFVMHAESRNSRKYCSTKIWSYTVIHSGLLNS